MQDHATPKASTSSATARTKIYWDAVDNFSLVPAGWVEEVLNPLVALASAGTWGAARVAACGTWLEAAVEAAEEYAEEAGLSTDDATVLDRAASGMTTENLAEFVPAPWDVESLFSWFPSADMDIIEEHCQIGGASPAGHIDEYRPADVPALLAALEARGYSLEQLPITELLIDALDKLS